MKAKCDMRVTAENSGRNVRMNCAMSIGETGRAGAWEKCSNIVDCLCVNLQGQKGVKH